MLLKKLLRETSLLVVFMHLRRGCTLRFDTRPILFLYYLSRYLRERVGLGKYYHRNLFFGQAVLLIIGILIFEVHVFILNKRLP